MNKSEILQALQEREKALAVQVEELSKAQAELNEMRAAIKALGSSPAKSFSTEYDINLSWREKIKYTLKKKGHCSGVEVVEFIKENEPSNQSVKSNVATYLSRMLGSGEIKARLEDGINDYYL